MNKERDFPNISICGIVKRNRPNGPRGRWKGDLRENYRFNRCTQNEETYRELGSRIEYWKNQSGLP